MIPNALGNVLSQFLKKGSSRYGDDLDAPVAPRRTPAVAPAMPTEAVASDTALQDSGVSQFLAGLLAGDQDRSRADELFKRADELMVASSSKKAPEKKSALGGGDALAMGVAGLLGKLLFNATDSNLATFGQGYIGARGQSAERQYENAYNQFAGSQQADAANAKSLVQQGTRFLLAGEKADQIQQQEEAARQRNEDRDEARKALAESKAAADYSTILGRIDSAKHPGSVRPMVERLREIAKANPGVGFIVPDDKEVELIIRSMGQKALKEFNADLLNYTKITGGIDDDTPEGKELAANFAARAEMLANDYGLPKSLFPVPIRSTMEREKFDELMSYRDKMMTFKEGEASRRALEFWAKMEESKRRLDFMIANGTDRTEVARYNAELRRSTILNNALKANVEAVQPDADIRGKRARYLRGKIPQQEAELQAAIESGGDATKLTQELNAYKAELSILERAEPVVTVTPGDPNSTAPLRTDVPLPPWGAKGNFGGKMIIPPPGQLPHLPTPRKNVHYPGPVSAGLNAKKAEKPKAPAKTPAKAKPKTNLIKDIKRGY